MSPRLNFTCDLVSTLQAKGLVYGSHHLATLGLVRSGKRVTLRPAPLELISTLCSLLVKIFSLLCGHNWLFPLDMHSRDPTGQVLKELLRGQHYSRPCDHAKKWKRPSLFSLCLLLA